MNIGILLTALYLLLVGLSNWIPGIGPPITSIIAIFAAVFLIAGK